MTAVKCELVCKTELLQAREEVRLTHFYYSEWPGGVEEAEQVNIIVTFTIIIILGIIIIIAGWRVEESEEKSTITAINIMIIIIANIIIILEGSAVTINPLPSRSREQLMASLVL